MPVPQAISSYTQLNGALMNLIGQMSHIAPQASVSMRIAAYYNLLQAKDLSGIERALLSSAFGADQISPALFQRFLGLIGKESAFLESFRALASDPMKAQLATALSGPEIERLNALRTLVIERAATGGFGIDPEQWFQWQTVKLSRLKAVENATANEVLTTTDALYRTARNDLFWYAIIAVVAAGLALALAFLIVRSIVHPLRRALDTIRSRGNDLTRHLNVPGSDELSQLYRAFNDSTANTERLVSSTMQSATFVKAASGEISKGNQDLAQRTEEQSDSLEQTAASMERITATVNQTTDNAREVQKASDEVTIQAQKASEVASRSAEEADNIRNLIDTNVVRVDEGNALVTQTSDTLETIATRVKQMSGLIADITHATAEESHGIQQINQAMAQLEDVTQHNAALVEEIAAASKSLDEQSEEMEHTIGRFTVNPSIQQASGEQQEDWQPSVAQEEPRTQARPAEVLVD